MKTKSTADESDFYLNNGNTYRCEHNLYDTSLIPTTMNVPLVR